MKKIEIEIPDGKRAKWVNGVLTLVDDIPKDVRDRIKTFEDALNKLEVRAANGDNSAKMLYDDWHNMTTDSENLIAYVKLCIITAALNKGWEPTFKKDEKRWYPWFNIEQDSLVYAYAYHAGPNLLYGKRLAFKSKELAEYAGKQFIDIYKTFVLGEIKRLKPLTAKINEKKSLNHE